MICCLGKFRLFHTDITLFLFLLGFAHFMSQIKHIYLYIINACVHVFTCLYRLFL